MILEINKKRGRTLLLALAIFQILLLINLTPANSYAIGEFNNVYGNTQLENKKDYIGNIFNFGLNLLIGFLTIKQIGIVSADEDELVQYCCPLTNSNAPLPNAACQDVLSTAQETCSVDLITTSCGETLICETGCCINEEGCELATRSKCEDKGGVLEEGRSCSGIAQCKPGCCVLETGYKWKTKQECRFLSDDDGKEMDFRDSIQTEQACLALRQTNEKGACLFEGRCIIETGNRCITLGGEFAGGAICTKPELMLEYNYNYQKEDHKGCVDGKEDIYWFDSNRNREGVVGGIEGSGDCDKGLETCSLNSAGTDYECNNLGCVDNTFFERHGRQPNHGESWCIYDGLIGSGLDTVGSEHWQASCLNGEINEGGPYKMCGFGGRTEICAESKSVSSNPNALVDFFITGECVFNEASFCTDYNRLEGEEMKKKCEGNNFCEYKHIVIDENDNSDSNDPFEFNICTPKYPKGSDLSDGEDDGYCAWGSIICKVVYKDPIDGGARPITNIECEQPSFTEELNNLCISLGDCGSYINYKGAGTDNSRYIGKKGFKVDGDGERDGKEGRDYKESTQPGCAGEDDDNCRNYGWTNYRGNEDSSISLIASGQFFNKTIQDYFGENSGFSIGNSDEDLRRVMGYIGKFAGGTGTLVQAGSMLGIYSLTTAPPFVLASTTMGTFATATLGIGAGILVGGYIAQLFGVEGTIGNIASMIGGGLAGGGLTLGGTSAATSLPLTTLAGTLFWGGIILIILAILFAATSYHTRYVEFECNPWSRPAGGADCEKCNDDPMKPCNKYRCESLGASCQFLDDSSENSPCISSVYENNPPIISDDSVLTSGYKFKSGNSQGVKIRRISNVDGSDCVEQSIAVKFNLNTNENAQCKWSLERPNNYENMEDNLFTQGTQWATDHTLEYLIPRVDEMNQVDVTGNAPNRIGNVKIYVRCKDYQDPPNPNFNDYVVDICVNEKDTTVVDHSFTKFDPENERKLPVGTNETELKMWIKETADCKYDTKSGTDYSAMPYEFLCNKHTRDTFGYLCTTNLSGLEKGENNFYIRCKDQPFEDESKRNTNGDDKDYTIYVTENELKIKSVSFIYDNGKTVKTISSGDTFKGRFEFISVKMKVVTESGSDNGESACFWKTRVDGTLRQMKPYTTYSEEHTQILEPRHEGTYVNYIECEDEAGNIAKTSATFNVEVDNNPPVVVRAFHDGSQLKIITNEISECYYNNLNRCNPFNFENATSMTTALSKEHTADWDPGKTYYIKCKDVWENPNDECAIVVKPST